MNAKATVLALTRALTPTLESASTLPDRRGTRQPQSEVFPYSLRRVIGTWMTFYSDVRPHSALGGRTPAEAYGEERAA